MYDERRWLLLLLLHVWKLEDPQKKVDSFFWQKTA